LRSAGLLDPDEIRSAGAERVKMAIGQRKLVDALFAKLAGHEAPEPPQPVQLSLLTAEAKSETDARYRMGVAHADLRATEPGPDPVVLQPSNSETVPNIDLVIDIPGRSVILWGVELRGKGPKGLQPQLFVALAALALRAGEIVSMADLAVLIQQLDGLPRKPVAPEARDLRYRLLRRLRSLLADHPRAGELEGVIENVSGAGLRLNCTSQVLRGRDEILE